MESTRGTGTSRQYSPEFKERAVRMVGQLGEETGERKGTVGPVVGQLECGVESLRSWVKPLGWTTVEAERIKELEGENRELRRATVTRTETPKMYPSSGTHTCRRGYVLQYGCWSESGPAPHFRLWIFALVGIECTEGAQGGRRPTALLKT